MTIQPNNNNSPHDFKVGAGYFPEAMRAYEIQCDTARQRGEIWTDKQQAVMKELHQAYVLTGKGFSFKRTAFPLAVGTGKSQSIAALMAAQSERRKQGKPSLSILVCVERHAQMEAGYQDALSYGVPAEYLGMYSSEHRLDDIDKVPFVFCTHAMMLRGKKRINDVNTYEGKERSLIVWDESMFAAKPVAIDLNDLSCAVHRLKIEAESRMDNAKADSIDAATYLQAFIDNLKAHRTHCCELTQVDETRYKAGLELLKNWKHQEDKKLLLTALDCSMRPSVLIEYVDGTMNRAAVMFDVIIPDSLKRLIILDASHNVRLLCSRHDTQVRTLNMDCRIKSFNKVQVTQLKQAAGRGTFDQELRRGIDSKIVARLVEEIAKYPPDESVLIVLLKQDAFVRGRGRVSHSELLKEAIESKGIDVDQTYTATHANGTTEQQKRFEFVTWGQHIGVNHWRHCKHVVCVGVLRRNMLDIKSQVIANERDLQTPAVQNSKMMAEVELSEAFHNLMQAAGRGSCRITVAGEAEPMTLFFAFSDEFPAAWWSEAMPGVSVTVIEGKANKGSDAVTAIIKALEGLPERQTEVSTKTLRLLAGLSDIHKNTYSNALRQVTQSIKGWEYSGRSFVRLAPFEPVAA